MLSVGMCVLFKHETFVMNIHSHLTPLFYCLEQFINSKVINIYSHILFIGHNNSQILKQESFVMNIHSHLIPLFLLLKQF